MGLVEDLKAAKALIDTPERWTKGYWEHDGCFCAAGALRAALGFPETGNRVDWSFWSHPAVMAVDGLTQIGIADFNDDPRTTHADIMALFDRAIAAAA